MCKLIFQTEIGKLKKRIRVLNSDLTSCNDNYDIVVTSAFKNDYYPIPDTLIGALKLNKGIDLSNLVMNPEINLREFGGWLSIDTNTNFKRIACVEIFSFEDLYSNSSFINNKLNHNILHTDKLLSQTFSTMSFLIKQAIFKGIDVKRIALPILGSGNQGIEIEYVIPPLLTECLSLLNDIASLEEIDFYEIDYNKAINFVDNLKALLLEDNKPDVFISYSTKNSSIALELADILKNNNVSYWMAPKSIPPTSNYIKEISKALMNISILLVVLTKEAEDSAWVPSEISSAKGSKKILLGFKPKDYIISPEFDFLFQSSQIYLAYEDADYKNTIVEIIKNKLNK